MISFTTCTDDIGNMTNDNNVFTLMYHISCSNRSPWLQLLGLPATFPDGVLWQEADNEDCILKGKFTLFWILSDSCILISWPSD